VYVVALGCPRPTQRDSMRMESMTGKDAAKATAAMQSMPQD
jgi:hypothetical protein